MSDISPAPDSSRAFSSDTYSDIDVDAIPRLIGAHMPTSGGLKTSLINGKAIGCTAVQLFTASPRQWRHTPPGEEDIAAFLAARAETGIGFLVSHDSYLINLAAPSPDVLERSTGAFRAELDRAEVLGISWVVTHMGAHLDKGEEEAMNRLVESLKAVLEDTDRAGYKVGIALETTAGQGTGLGWRFEQLGYILNGVEEHPRLGVCMDTCHVFAAGYDLRSEVSYKHTFDLFDSQIGLSKLKVLHCNDSKKPLGSRVDRHEHIGEGEIGLETFARLMTDPALLSVPAILETPDSETMHPVNLRRLQLMALGKIPEITVDVLLFGHYSDIFGEESIKVTLPVGSRVKNLAHLLSEKDQRLSGISTNCRFAMNDEYVDLDTHLKEGSIVAATPPVSGG